MKIIHGCFIFTNRKNMLRNLSHNEFITIVHIYSIESVNKHATMYNTEIGEITWTLNELLFMEYFS